MTNATQALEQLRAERDKLRALQDAAPDLYEALREMEIAANTVAHCYGRNPGNFAAALRDLDIRARVARDVLAKAQP